MKSTKIKNLCIKENYFTCGTNSEYQEMFDMITKNIDPYIIAKKIYMHSDTHTDFRTILDQVNEILA